MAKPILFNTEMVKAILEGRKRVTRRVIKPQPKTDSTVTLFSTFDYADISYDGVLELSPYQPGDILYVRETWAKVKGESRYLYKADKVDFIYKELHSSWKWKPSIHMPKEAARIFLRVTNVSVAKLQDITEEQAKAEGAEANNVLDAVHEFRIIWDDTLKGEKALIEYGWFANPWVWVVEFERMEKPNEWI